MAVPPANPVQCRMIGEILQQRQIGVEAAALEHDAKLAQSRRRVAAYVVADDADLAADIVVEARCQSKQRRLAGAVRPEQRHEAAARHGERDIGERLDRSETVADAADQQRVDRLLGWMRCDRRDHFTMNRPAMPLPSRPRQPQAYSPGRIGTKKISASPARSISIS